MSKVEVKKETTVQSYGEFYDVFCHLKKLADPLTPGWLKAKMAALTMAAFTIEAHANHIGQIVFPSWKTIEKGISPLGKYKIFIESKKIEIKYGEAPFNTVNELMKWRNQIAHGTTETWNTIHEATVETYDGLLGKIEHSSWKEYVLNADLDKIDKDCVALMEMVHEKTIGNLDMFLASSWHSGTATFRATISINPH
jgi:hypothetical protein